MGCIKLLDNGSKNSVQLSFPTVSSNSNKNIHFFYTGSGSSFVALLVYVDDIIVASKDLAAISQAQAALQKLFKLKVIGD